MTEKSALMESLQKMIERDQLNILRDNPYTSGRRKYHGILLNPMDARALEETETDPKATIAGIPIYESPFVKPGEYGLIPKRELSWKQIEFKASDLAFDYGGFTRRFYNQMAEAFMIPSHYLGETYLWQRHRDETLQEWGSRLFERNLLDDPEIRWEYQKTILSAPVKWANKLFGRT